MKEILFKKINKIGYITLNRPKKLNALNDIMPFKLSEAIKKANDDNDIHVIILSGKGKAFCSGYDLEEYAGNKKNKFIQNMPWDPISDYKFMWENVQHFMSIWHSTKPVICKIHGHALAGGSDLALCSDIIIMANNAKIGYMPSRVWGTPTTAMWVYRIGAEKAKRLLLTGDKITGKEAEKIGLVLKSVPIEDLDNEVNKLAKRMASVPINQLAMQKILINQAIENTGLIQTQRLATFFDGMSRHSSEGINFKNRVEKVGWKQAVQERDLGIFDWTNNEKL